MNAVCCSVCLLLKWGAMDAEAYPEDAEKVLNSLWEIGSSMQMHEDSQWTKARVSALMSLGQYEVSIGFQSLACLRLHVFQAIFGFLWF